MDERMKERINKYSVLQAVNELFNGDNYVVSIALGKKGDMVEIVRDAFNS